MLPQSFWRTALEWVMPNSITDVMTATVGNVTAYRFAVASMISPRLGWELLHESEQRNMLVLQKRAAFCTKYLCNHLQLGRGERNPDLMRLLLSLRAGQEGSSTYLPEPSRAFCFLLLWIPASCPGSLPPLAERWHCSGVSSLSVLFRITPKLAHCRKYALWVEKSSCSNARGFQWNIRDFWRVSGS